MSTVSFWAFGAVLLLGAVFHNRTVISCHSKSVHAAVGTIAGLRTPGRSGQGQGGAPYFR